MSDVGPVFEKIPVPVGGLFTLRADNHEFFSGLTVIPHYHMMHELMWFKEASGTFTIAGERFTLRNATLVFVPALMIHDLTIEPQQNHSRYLLQFEKEWIDDFLLCPSVTQRGVLLQLSDKDATRIETLFSWCTELHQINNRNNVLFKSLIKSILIDAFNHFQQSDAVLEREVDTHLDVLLTFLHHVDQHADYSITTEDAARRCHWSKSWFSRTFKNHFGMSFKSFMLLRKINIAVKLLTVTDLRISDISNQAGFTDSAYFCHKFRQLFSETPLSFRERCRFTQEVSR